jgi:hypothetical protein
VSGEGISAEYRNGVLRVSLPKREEIKARRIEIKGESGDAKPKTIDAKAEASKSEQADKAMNASGKTS